ncbi:hypothetical protein SSX86_021552 [Deinandra increscens subsp. villosa]|uniref:Uncharacterized protein n=1 Tax=Deinandra increscens subsp. villosa TaxID=3103831 RepID=A0AAP0GTW8_9ASTR
MRVAAFQRGQLGLRVHVFSIHDNAGHVLEQAYVPSPPSPLCVLLLRPSSTVADHYACQALCYIQLLLLKTHLCCFEFKNVTVNRYSVRCMMDDGFGKISVMLSDASLIAMIGLRSFNLISIREFDDDNSLPTPISSLINTNWLLTISKGHKVDDSLLEFQGAGVSLVPLTVIPPDGPATHDIGTSEDRWDPGVDISDQSGNVPSSQGSLSPPVHQPGGGNVAG